MSSLTFERPRAIGESDWASSLPELVSPPPLPSAEQRGELLHAYRERHDQSLENRRRQELLDLQRANRQELEVLKEKTKAGPLPPYEQERAMQVSLASMRIDQALESHGKIMGGVDRGIQGASIVGLSSLAFAVPGVGFPLALVAGIGGYAVPNYLAKKLMEVPGLKSLLGSERNARTAVNAAIVGGVVGVPIALGAAAVWPVAAAIGLVAAGSHWWNKLWASRSAKKMPDQLPASDAASERLLSSYRLIDLPYKDIVNGGPEAEKRVRKSYKLCKERCVALEKRKDLQAEEREELRNLQLAIKGMEHGLEAYGDTGEALGSGIQVGQTAAVGMTASQFLAPILGATPLGIMGTVAGSVLAGSAAWFLPQAMAKAARKTTRPGWIPRIAKLAGQVGLVGAATLATGGSVLPVAGIAAGIMTAMHLTQRAGARAERKEQEKMQQELRAQQQAQEPPAMPARAAA